MRWALLLAALLASSSPLWASPPPSSPSVSLSPAEAAQIEAAMEQAQAALKASNKEIETQAQLLTRLWLLSGALALAVVVEAVTVSVVVLRK